MVAIALVLNSICDTLNAAFAAVHHGPDVKHHSGSPIPGAGGAGNEHIAAIDKGIDVAGEVGVNQALGVPLVHHGDILAHAFFSETVLDHAVDSEPGRCNAEAGGQGIAHLFKAGGAQSQRLGGTLLLLKSGQHGVPILVSNGSFKTAVLQPVAANGTAAPCRLTA